MRFLQCITLPYRVEFEHLDAAGFVHHPAYLYFLERARIQCLTQAGWDHNAHLLKGNFVIPVAEMHLRYLKSLTTGDIWVVTLLAAASDHSMRVRQLISSQPVSPVSEADFDELMHHRTNVAFYAEVRSVGVDKATWKPSYFPEELRQALHIPTDTSHPRTSKPSVRLTYQ